MKWRCTAKEFQTRLAKIFGASENESKEAVVERLTVILQHMVETMRMEWWEITIGKLLAPPDQFSGEDMLEAIFLLAKRIPGWENDKALALIDNITILAANFKINKESVVESAMKHELNERLFMRTLQAFSAAA